MMLFRPLCFLFFLVFASPSWALTPEEWEQDLDFMTETLTRVHPNPYSRTSPQTFRAEAEALRAALPELSDEEIVIAFSKIIGFANDGHSGLDPVGDVVAFNLWLPIRAERFAEGVFITAAAPEMAYLIGGQIVKIGDSGGTTAFEEVMKIANGDNAFSKMNGATALFPNTKILQGLGVVDDPDAVSLTVKTVGGEIREFVMSAIEQPFSLHWFYSGRRTPGKESVHAHERLGAALDTTYRNRTQLYSLEYLADSKILFVQFNLFVNYRDFQVPGLTAPTPTLAEFYQQVYEALEANAVEKLVIDVRHNGGGNNQLVIPFVDALADSEFNRKGKLFVIAGRTTYSAAMNFVSLMETKTEAQFAGEPAGGSPLHYGDSTGFRLPNSRMVFGVSTLPWSLGVNPWDLRERVQPDFLVIPKAANFFKGKDGALKAIMNAEANPPLTERMKAVYEKDGLPAALRLFEKMTNQTPVPEPWNGVVYHLVTFAAWLGEKSTEEQEAVLRSGTKTFPDSDLAWYKLGYFYFYQRQYQEAVDALAKAKQLNPGVNLIDRLYNAARRKPGANN